MADDFPTEYDDILIGTGVQESIVAAALARIGRKVLHLDRNDYYSGEWASFHLKGMLDWISKNQELRDHPGPAAAGAEPTPEDATTEGETLTPLPQSLQTATNIEATVYVKDKPDPPPEPTPPVVSETGDPSFPSGSAEPHTSEAQESYHQSNQDQSGPTTPSPVESSSSRNEGEDVAHHSQDPQNAAATSSAAGTHTDRCNEPEGETGNQSSCPNREAMEDSGVSEGSASIYASGGDLDQSVATAPEGSVVENSAQDVISGGSSGESGGAVGVDEGSPSGEGAEQRGALGGVAEGEVEERRREWTWEEIHKGWRKFNIDLAPKLMFCRGAMVELLVSSRISRYAEFKAVTRILTHINGNLEQVPCSRADVFSSRYVSVLEKRMLMKLIEFCLDYQNREDEYREFKEKPFADFLKSRKLTKTLQHFVIHSIAMVTADTATQQALQAMQFFLRSLGRYGNTAFLWTLYGSGELPQCFCRMCAVFAGIYVLRTSAQSLITDNENNIKGIIDTEGRRLTCRNLIMEYSYVPQASAANHSFVSRGVLITDRSVKPTETEQITLVTVPPIEGSSQPVHMIEVGYAACAAPNDLYVVHLTSKASSSDVSAKEDLKRVVDTFFQVASKDSPLSEDDLRPCILWSLFFTQRDVTETSDDALREGLPGNVHITSGPGPSIGFEHAVAQAQRIFERICPGEEFLPAAPEPEDLVFEDPAQDNPGHSQAGFEKDTTSDGENKEISATDGPPAETQTGTSPGKEMPAKTSPFESSPTVTSHPETSPAETSPAETSPAETSPAETSPAETSPTETSPAETSAKTSPAETS